jgi:plastocyanin
MRSRFRKLGILAALALVATLVPVNGASADSSVRRVQILDACDPATFNAAIGEGTCVRKGGGVKFEKFINQLITKGEAPAWRFSPGQLKLDAGGTITARNRGGEFHTFSEVAEFGGGCIPEINELLGLEPVPECEIPNIFATTGVPPGASLTTAPLAAGEHLFQCLIHPWQRTTVKVR